ncbi:MAG: hypothetical protein R3B45_07230 [Bdellovibrionota bacterium]
MNFHFLQYKLSNTSHTKTWKFRKGKHNYCNFFVLPAEQADFEDFCSAFSNLFTNSTEEKFERCILELSNNSGDTWRIEKKDGLEFIIHNGKQLTHPNAYEMMNKSLLDLSEEYILEHKKVPTRIFEQLNAYGIKASRQNLWVSELSKDWEWRSQLFDYLNNEKNQTEEKLSKKLNCSFERNHEEINNLYRKIMPLYYSYHDTASQLDSITSQIKNDLHPQVYEIQIIEKQLSIIEEIANLQKSLVQSGTSINEQKNNITEIKNEISSRLKSLKLNHISEFKPNSNWLPLIEILSKKQILEQLLKQTDKAKESITTVINPIIDEHFAAIHDVLTENHQCSEELESCLSTVNLEIATNAVRNSLFSPQVPTNEKNTPSPSQKEKIEKVLNWFNTFNFKSLFTSKEKIPENEKNTIERLETFRMSIEIILAKFQELRANLNSGNDKAKEIVADFEMIESRYHKSYKRLTDKWNLLQQEFNLPPDTDLKQLNQIILNHTRIIELIESIKITEEKIKKRKIILTKLESLVWQWRELNNSQKQTNLKNSTILFTEAKSILRYESEKRKQLEKYNSAKTKAQLASSIDEHLKTRLASIKNEWENAFADANISPMDISNVDITTYLNEIEKIRSIESLLLNKNDCEFGSKISNISQNTLTFLQWRDQTKNNRHRLKLLETIENNYPKAPCFLFLHDQVLIDYLKKLGLSSLEHVELQKDRKNLNTPEIQNTLEQKISESSIMKNSYEDIESLPQKSTTLSGRKRPTTGKIANTQNLNPHLRTAPTPNNPKVDAILELFQKKPQSFSKASK